MLVYKNMYPICVACRKGMFNFNVKGPIHSKLNYAV